jgi:hypothetical protein
LTAFVALLIALQHLTTWAAQPDANQDARSAPAAAPGSGTGPPADPASDEEEDADASDVALATKDGEIDDSGLTEKEKKKRQALIKRLRKSGILCMGQFGTGGLVFNVNGDASNAAIAELLKLDDVRSLQLLRGKYTADCLDTISQLKSLQDLNLKDLAVDDSGLAKLSGLRALRMLGLRLAGSLTDEGLAQLKKMPLGTLRLSGVTDRITEKGYQELASLPELGSLSLDGDSITDESLRRLSESKTLTELTLSGKGFSDDGLKSLAAMEHLQRLTLTDERITAEGIRHLSRAPQLKALSLLGCPKIDDSVLAAVGQMPALEILAVVGGSLTDDGLAQLNALIELRWLLLKSDTITGSGLASLTDLRQLAVLSVTGASVSNEVFAHVSQFPKLQMLRVGTGKRGDKAAITEEGLKRIGNAPSLDRLTLVGVDIAEQGLQSLVDVPQLKALTFVDASDVEEEHPRFWDVAAQRKKLAVEREAADPAAAAERKRILALLSKQRAQIGGSLLDSQGMTIQIRDPESNDETLALLEKLHNIRLLILNPASYSDVGFASIARLTNL